MNDWRKVRTTTVAAMRPGSRLTNRHHPNPQRQRPFEIALICTGNRFRSPLAEGFLRRHGRDLPLALRSFGTRDLGPLPPLPQALDAATAYELDLDRHRASSLQGVELRDADLVLGFERVHVATAVVDAGAPRRRTFTLPELVELLDWLPRADDRPSAARARERVARAHELRAASRESANLAELRDPIGGPPAWYSETAARLAQLCHTLLRGLFGERTFDARHVPAKLTRRGGRS